MKYLKPTFLCLSLTLVACFLFSVAHTPKASAWSASDWNASRIIDDSVFFNPNTMSTQEIQAFLNSKVPVCDTSGEQPSSHGGTRGDWGRANGVPPPYTCLKDFTQTTQAVSADAYCGGIAAGSKSAATIIKEIASVCNINPQVLIVTLQKEQSLLTDDWPWPIQYRSAMGYGCPDTAPCDAEYYGFFNQVYNAAHQFQRYAKQPQLFNYRAGQTSYVAYSPDGSCGGTSVAIQNAATAALYNYTPYQPNPAALNAGWGSAYCGAYGNRNFWQYYWSWFGNPIGPDYAWLIDSFSYSGGDSSIGQGQTETMTLKARNVSRHPWYNSGGCPVRLATWGPNRASQFANGSWVNAYRPANMQEAVVQPNELATFSFQITPGQVGTFVEALNLVVENCQWMPWAGLSPTITVTPPYNWQVSDIIYDTGTGYMEPGSTQLITIKALNSGSAAWSKSSGPQIRLGTWVPGRDSPVASSWLNSSRAATMNEATVAPGQVAGFQFYVRVPTTGMFYERLNLVAEGVQWFNDTGLTLYLQGTNYSWQPLDWYYSTPSANIPRGTKFTVTVVAKNTGQTTWRKAGNFPVRLGTWYPGRGSALEDTSWLSPIRAAELQQATVPPGGVGTFVFTATSPTTPGPRLEGLNLVAEGTQWFSGSGIQLYVNSQ